MQMARRFGLPSLLPLMLFACGESITAPGSCPDFCPTAEIRLIDTLLTGVIERDTTFTGYVQPHQATSMQVVGGPTQRTRGMLRFLVFSDSTFLDSLNIVPVLALDSFRLEVFLTNRSPDVTGLEITVHRLPAYAPELNPVEGLWAWCKGTAVANLCPDGLAPVRRQLRLGRRRLGRHPDRLRGFLHKAGLFI